MLLKIISFCITSQIVNKKLDGVIDFNLLTCLITIPKEYSKGDLVGKLFEKFTTVFN